MDLLTVVKKLAATFFVLTAGLILIELGSGNIALVLNTVTIGGTITVLLGTVALIIAIWTTWD